MGSAAEATKGVKIAVKASMVIERGGLGGWEWSVVVWSEGVKR